MAQYAAAVDQGTTSTRFMIFDHGGNVIGIDQKEHEQIYPKPGWVEHDPKEVWTPDAGGDRRRPRKDRDQRLRPCRRGCHQPARDHGGLGPKHRRAGLQRHRLAGHPHRQDLVNELAADGGQDRFRDKVGLPLATYFSGPKIRWILDNVEGARGRAEAGDLAFGNMDTWVIWNLTGGTDGGVHITDVTNASRTMLMDLHTLDWDDDILSTMGVPRSVLPEIRSSAEVYGEAKGTLGGIPVAGDLGDQQAATFGQTCFDAGNAKNTYGTGNFMLLNTGTELVPSKSGLLTTTCYKIGDQDAVFALEGSIAITGALVQWLRDNLGMIESSADVEALAKTVEDNGGMYIVPAFSGLFAPYWKSDARGVFAGLTRYINKGHFARATLEATAWQTREVLDAMNKDSGVELTELKVDGGMVGNDLLMQFQADVLGVPVIRPAVPETTSLGAAYAAGLATGFWAQVDDLRENWVKDKEWTPQMDADKRESEYASWKKAVTRTFDWVD